MMPTAPENCAKNRRGAENIERHQRAEHQERQPHGLTQEISNEGVGREPVPGLPAGGDKPSEKPDQSPDKARHQHQRQIIQCLLQPAFEAADDRLEPLGNRGLFGQPVLDGDHAGNATDQIFGLVGSSRLLHLTAQRDHT
jgi:hypothetical protein